jgi:RNA polymerase sigma-70 factor (ECF subfamily)
MDQDPDKRPASVGQRGNLVSQLFHQIHRDYGHRLIKSIAGFVKDRDRAEDIAAQAFEKAWEKREQFRGDASASTWVEAIARNEIRASARHDRIVRIDSLDEVDAPEVPAPGLITDHLEKEEDRYRIQNALKQLPMVYRRVLTARFIEGLPIREIASREQVPPGTVGSRIQKGKQLLRDALEKPETARAQFRESPDPPTWDR